MLALVGILVVFGAVIGGFLMEHGQLAVLMQPAELVIIVGASLGTILVANPLPTVIKILKSTLGIVKSSPYNKAFYLETLKMLNEIFSSARKNGFAKLEADVETPNESPLFANYPKLLKDHHALAFICDSLRIVITGGIATMDIDEMMERDIEVHHHDAMEPIHALTTVADALPGLGIVAAVLGVVITMGALGGPPEEIGHKVAAALVGTFLGILLCYGVVAPIANNLSKTAEAESQYYNCMRVGVISFVKGIPPIMAVEFARRAIPTQVRPTFQEMENNCRGGGASAAPVSEAA